MSNTISVRTMASPQQAFDCLADLHDYGRWLQRSASYRGTRTYRGVAGDAGGNIRAGDTYTDLTSLGRVYGMVTQVDPGRSIVFSQATRHGAMSIKISYHVVPHGDGCLVIRTGETRFTGPLRMVAPLVDLMIRQENNRTMRALAQHLDHVATHPTHQTAAPPTASP